MHSGVDLDSKRVPVPFKTALEAEFNQLWLFYNAVAMGVQ